MSRTSKLWLSQEQQDDFERFARSRTLAARLVQRSQILLMAAAHKPDREIAQALGIARQTVSLWLERFVEQGIAGIGKDAPRSGSELLHGGADLAGPRSEASPCEDVQAEQRSPLRRELEDIVNLYLHPPPDAIILAVDETLASRHRTTISTCRAPLPHSMCRTS